MYRKSDSLVKCAMLYSPDFGHALPYVQFTHLVYFLMTLKNHILKTIITMNFYIITWCLAIIRKMRDDTPHYCGKEHTKSKVVYYRQVLNNE